MNVSHLLLLLGKDLRYIWRSKCWTLFEVIVPFFLIGFFTYGGILMQQSPEMVTKLQSAELSRLEMEELTSYKIAGDYTDGIFNFNCKIPMLFGVFSEKVNNSALQRFLKDLQIRYLVKNPLDGTQIYIMNMSFFETEQDLMNALMAETHYSNPCEQKYSGGVVIEKLDTSGRSLRYTLVHHHSGAFVSLPPLSMQYAMNDLFTKMADPDNKNDFEFSVYSVLRLTVNEAAGSFLPELLGMAAVFFSAICIMVHTVVHITSEKSSGMLSYLRVMGLNSSEYYLSHTIVAALKCTIAFAPVGLVFLYGSQAISGALFVTIVAIFAADAICMAILMTSIFHKPLLAIVATVTIYCVLGIRLSHC